jgi:hypothetical protein
MWLGTDVFLRPCCFTGDGGWPRVGRNRSGSDEEVVGSFESKVLEKRFREPERVLGKKTLGNDILRESEQVMREKTYLALAVVAGRGFAMKAIADTPGFGSGKVMGFST